MAAARIASVLLVAVLLTPASAYTWPTFHNDARNAGVEGSVPYAIFEELWWAVPTVEGLKVQASPVHDDGILVVAYTPFRDGPGKGLVRGIGLETGKVLWEHETPAGIVGTPAIALNRVYAADRGGNLVGLDLDTGEQVDSAKFGSGSFGAITYHEGKIFFGTEAGTLLSYNLEPKLDKLWEFKVTDVFRESSLDAQNKTICPTTAGNRHEARAIRSAPAVHNGMVYFGSKNFHVYAVREAGNADGTTQVMWTYQTGDIIEGSPAVDVARNRIIIGSYDEHVYALDSKPAQSGSNPCFGHKATPVWSFEVPSPETGTSSVHSTPAIADNRIVFGANNGRVYGLSAATGAKLWEAATGGPVFSSPAIAGSLTVVGSDDRSVHWINVKNGSLALQYKADAPIKTSPALDGTDAIVVTEAGTVLRMGAAPPPRADLVVDEVTAGDDGFIIVIKNIGAADSIATETLVTWSSTLRVTTPKLGPGNTTELFVEDTLSGSIVLEVIVDPDDRVWEVDETANNRYENALFVAPPPEPPAPVNTTEAPAEEASSVGRWIMIAGIAVAVMGLGVGGMLWYNRRQDMADEEEGEEEEEY